MRIGSGAKVYSHSLALVIQIELEITMGARRRLRRWCVFRGKRHAPRWTASAGCCILATPETRGHAASAHTARSPPWRPGSRTEVAAAAGAAAAGRGGCGQRQRGGRRRQQEGWRRRQRPALQEPNRAGLRPGWHAALVRLGAQPRLLHLAGRHGVLPGGRPRAGHARLRRRRGGGGRRGDRGGGRALRPALRGLRSPGRRGAAGAGRRGAAAAAEARGGPLPCRSTCRRWPRPGCGENQRMDAAYCALRTRGVSVLYIPTRWRR